jgi:phosphatidylethanolamine N-methyltransferase
MDALLEQADTLVARYSPLIDINKSSLATCLLSIAFNPTAWNIVARNGVLPLPPTKQKKENVADAENGKEYRNKTITRLFGGNARNGCYFLAFMIFAAGMVRDNLFVLFLLSLRLSFPRLSPFPPPYSSLTNFDPKRTGTT